MRIVIVGPGALGCLFACRLAQKSAQYAKQDEIILLDHRPERAEALSRSGLALYEMDGSVTRAYPLVTAHPENMAGADLVLVCVKSTALADCLDARRELFATSALTVFIQNGINHLDLADSETFAMAFASTTEGANLVSMSEARHAGRGLTYFGLLHIPGDGERARLEKIAEYFSQAGLAATVCADIRDRIWQKLLINAGINALTALHDCPNGALPRNPAWREQMAALVEEARQVAMAAGVATPPDAFAKVLEICQATAQNISSMLQDVRAGRSTEIEAINGAVVRLGEKFGVATPVNAEITRRVRALRQGKSDACHFNKTIQGGSHGTEK